MNPSPPDADREFVDLTDFCRAVLECGDLETKLSAPRDREGAPLPDHPSGAPIEIERPARDPGLRMESGGDALPRPQDLAEPEMRRLCLSRFAHHELQAVEYFAWALLRWPDAPAELRRGLTAALVDEQRHCRLYLDRLTELGGGFDTDDHSDYFWRQAPAIAAAEDGLGAFLAAMGLTLEQANLDFTLTYRDAFADAGDETTAAICQVVHDDEIAHVALAARWMARLANREASDLELYLASVPFPLGPARAKGRRFERAPRERAGLSDALIEHVRKARVQDQAAIPIELIPNLGAEESDPTLGGPAPGEEAKAYHDQPPVRTAAHLWSLLFPRHTQLRIPPRNPKADWAVRTQRELWPPDLGPEATTAAFPFLDGPSAPRAWFPAQNIQTATAEHLDAQLTGPPPHAVAECHDKAFAIRAAQQLGLNPRGLDACLEVIEPEALRNPEALRADLEAQLAAWPDWTEQRFTLKPRFGSSGRGRIGGTTSLDGAKVTGALPRLAARGGAIFEPWLDRTCDLSVSLHVPPPNATEEALVLLGSLELWTSSSGVYKGHCGEVDSRGRVFSGDRDDEALRADAAAIANHARAAGFFGPCGVDAFRYAQPNASNPGDPIPRLRSVVEFNARPTMGLVAIGLVKRALPRVRRKLDLHPGDRRGFALTYRAADDREWRKRVYAHVGNDAVIVDLKEASLPGDPQASLVFARDPDSIRRARRDAFGC